MLTLGKPHSTDALLKKLKSLHSTLASLDQETVETKKLSPLVKELVQSSLLLHKDKGIKAYVACCLADILRCFAPDAPFTQSQLRDIFQFFLRQLTTGLSDADSVYFSQYFHLLESLATVKSVVLICDLPSAEQLITDFFRGFFAVKQPSKKVELFMADILAAIVDEAAAVPSDVLEILMADCTSPLAVSVCTETAPKLHRYVASYFTDILLSSQEDEAHTLVKRLYSAVPALLLSVIPQLEEELHAESVHVRSIATATLGEMFFSSPHLISSHPSLFPVFLARRNDKSPVVRLKFIESTRGFYSSSTPDLLRTMEQTLILKLLDPDPLVRSAACRVFDGLSYEVVSKSVGEDMLRALEGRLADRKPAVRLEAATSLAKLYHLAYPDLSSPSPSPTSLSKFSWIPTSLLSTISSIPDARAEIEGVLAEWIWPIHPDTLQDHTTRLLTTLRFLPLPSNFSLHSTNLSTKDPSCKPLSTFLTLTTLKLTRPIVYEVFVDACVAWNAGTLAMGDGDKDKEGAKKKLKAVIQHLSATYPDPPKAASDLQAFADRNDKRLYKLLRTLMDEGTELEGIAKAETEFLRRTSSSDPTPSTSTQPLSTMHIFLLRCSLRIINRSSIPVLLEKLKLGPKEGGRKSLSKLTKSTLAAHHSSILLNLVSKNCPGMYRGCIPDLVKALGIDGDDQNQNQDQDIDPEWSLSVDVSLQALAGLVKKSNFEQLLVGDRGKILGRIQSLAVGVNYRHAKFAARILALSEEEEICIKVVETISSNLSSLKSTSTSSESQILSHLTALVQFARFAPDAFESKSDVITGFLLKQLLMVPTLVHGDQDEYEEWAEDDEISDLTKAKITAVKLLRWRSLVHAGANSAISDDKEKDTTTEKEKEKEKEKQKQKLLEIASPVLKMLATILDGNGSLCGGVEGEDIKVLSRLRLQASISLLHLSTIEVYANALVPRFIKLALTVQDACFNVRMTFLTKLIALLHARKLPARYNVVLFLAALDPEEDVKQMAASYVATAMRRLPPAIRVQSIELVFIRLLHILAHHPDFATTEEGIIDSAKYIQFYLDTVLNPENLSLLYHLASKGKTVRDAESHTYSENLYMMCEIAQELIRNRAQQNSWNIPSYPGKLKLPSDILKPHPSVDVAKKIVKQTYLPAEAVSWLNTLFAPPPKEKKERKAPVKRKAPTNSNGHAKRSRKKRKQTNETDDESDPDPETTDVDMTDANANANAATSSAGEEDDEPPGGKRARNQAKARAERHEARTRRIATPVSSDV